MTPELYGLMAMACVALGLVAIPGLKAEPPGGVETFEPAAASGRSSLTARLIEWLSSRLGPRLFAVLRVGRRDSIARRLDLAGRPGGMTLEGFVGRQAAYVALGGVLGLFALLVGSSWVCLPIGLAVGWWLPEVTLSRRGRLRQERIERDLPDFLDILAVTVRAGLGYRLALGRVAETLEGPVAEEMTLTLRQMGLGESRRAAFEALRDRNASESLKSFVAAQLQAEELGVPLADALNDIAIDMRRRSHQAARRRAQQAAPRVSLLTTTLIVPGAVILLMVSLVLGSGILGSGLLGN